MFRVHSVSQRPNLRHLGEPLGGAKSLLEAVSFEKALLLTLCCPLERIYTIIRMVSILGFAIQEII